VEERRFIGLGFGLSATTAWGLFPIYWKQLSTVAPFEALCHKLLWSLGFAAIFITIEGRWFEVKALLGQPRKLLWFLLSGVLTRKTHKKNSKAASVYCKFLLLNKLNLTKRTPLQ